MGPKRKAAEERADAGAKGADGARASADRRPGADQVAGVQAGERLDEDTVGEGVEHLELDSIDARHKRYRGLRLKAEAALELLVEAPDVPANVRASAVRTALELVGAIGVRSKDQRNQEDTADDLDPETLTIEGIDKEIAKLGRV